MSDNLPGRRSPVEVAEDAEGILLELAAVQPADGLRVDDNTWVWVQAFMDFDYEYAWLLDVRVDNGQGAVSDYLAVFKGFDHHGTAVFRASWWGHAVTYPEVPDVYDAASWWAGWVRDTRRGDHHGD